MAVEADIKRVRIAENRENALRFYCPACSKELSISSTGWNEQLKEVRIKIARCDCEDLQGAFKLLRKAMDMQRDA